MNRLDRLRDHTATALGSPVQLQRSDLPPNTVGNAAYLDLPPLLSGVILGMPVDMAALERDRQWLADSAALSEVFGDPPAYFAMRHREALALTTWLLTGNPGRDIFAEAVRLHERALGQLSRSGPDLVRDYLPDLVRDCFSAARCDRGVEIYRRHLGPPPDDPAEIASPLHLAGWLCAHVGRLQPPAAWVAVGSRVLSERLLDWLDRGQALDAALWLKLVFADSGAALTPTDALRRGGELLGALPIDPLARVMRESLGDPIDLDLFAGFLGVAGSTALPPGAVITAEFTDTPPLSVPVTEPELTTSLDRAVAAALADSSEMSLPDRLAEGARGRLVDVDGSTPVTLHRITIS